MESGDAAGAFQADLDACAREPIHIPGSIQPLGSLFVLDPADLEVLQYAPGPASNELLAGPVLGRSLKEVLAPPFDAIADQLATRVVDAEPAYLGQFQGGEGGGVHVIAHRSEDTIILELEDAAPGDAGSFADVYPLVRTFLDRLHAATDVGALATMAAGEIRRIIGFDRVLVYRFDENWNGTVIAEDRNERLPSYLDLRFPAADIPAQARELYRRNRLRLIGDARYTAVPVEPTLNPATGQPPDLSLSVLRSVSPVHLEYMRNMGTGASMSISLLRDGKLWGLVSCHNADPMRPGYHLRMACDFIGQILSLQISAREAADLADRRIALRAVQARLLARMAAEESFVEGLVADESDLLSLTNAEGAAIVSGSDCRLVGRTPAEKDVRRIVDWLRTHLPDDIVATDSLAEAMPAGEALKGEASGVLAIAISQLHASYVLWFRPEVVRTVRWGGSPLKPMEPELETGRIHPRKSFDVWKEAVRLRSLPWNEAEVDAAGQLRRAVVDIVLRNAEEMAALNEQLIRSNKELEAFSYSVSHDLRAPFRHIVGFSELLKQYEGDKLSERGHRYIDTIIESAVSAGTLVDDLLSFSQMGRATLHPISIDMNRLVEEVRQRLAMDMKGRPIEWRIADLPPAYGDPTMLRLVVQNLLDNAVKFTRDRDPAVIEIGTVPVRLSWRNRLVRGRQWRRLRHGLPCQIVRRVSAAPPGRGVRRDRHRPCQREAHRGASPRRTGMGERRG